MYDANGVWWEQGAQIAPGFQGPYGSLTDQSAAIATGFGETIPGKRSVEDFAPIFDSGLNRANQMPLYVPPWGRDGEDPLHSVFTSPRFGAPGQGDNPMRQYDAWHPNYGGARTEGIYDAYGGLGNPTSPEMTNAEIAYYGVYGPAGDLRGAGEGSTSYLNPGAVSNPKHVRQFLGQPGGPRQMETLGTAPNTHIFNAQSNFPDFDRTRGNINATTGYFRDVYGGGIPEPGGYFDGSYGPQMAGGSGGGSPWGAMPPMQDWGNGTSQPQSSGGGGFGSSSPMPPPRPFDLGGQGSQSDPFGVGGMLPGFNSGQGFPAGEQVAKGGAGGWGGSGSLQLDPSTGQYVPQSQSMGYNSGNNEYGYGGGANPSAYGPSGDYGAGVPNIADYSYMSGGGSGGGNITVQPYSESPWGGGGGGGDMFGGMADGSYGNMGSEGGIPGGGTAGASDGGFTFGIGQNYFDQSQQAAAAQSSYQQNVASQQQSMFDRNIGSMHGGWASGPIFV